MIYLHFTFIAFTGFHFEIAKFLVNIFIAIAITKNAIN